MQISNKVEVRVDGFCFCPESVNIDESGVYISFQFDPDAPFEKLIGCSKKQADVAINGDYVSIELGKEKLSIDDILTINVMVTRGSKDMFEFLYEHFSKLA